MSKEITYCYPTHIEKTGELLKIILQKDRKLGLFVEEYIFKFLDEIKDERYVPKKEDIHPGLVCIGQYDDQQFYRIKVLDKSLQNLTVNVLFIDYGNFASLSLSDIRLLNYSHNTLLNIPPLAITCFLEGVNVLKQWNDEELSTLRKFILYEERQCVIRQLSSDIFVVNIYIANSNKYLNTMIIENDLGTALTDTKLMIIAKGMMPSGLQYSDRAEQNRLRLLKQKASEQQVYGQMMTQFEPMSYQTDKLQMPDSNSSMQMLSVGTTHHVFVSHMEDGPYSFFVQLKTTTEDALPRLTNLLKQQKPIPHIPPLMPGCMVMTHVVSDNSFRRSIVMNIRHDSCLVYHMDFGNCDDVPSSLIYQLPSLARHAPAMALRFCLADMKLQHVTDSAKAYFQEFLERKCVLIRVVHEEQGNPLYQYCEMFYDNKNVKEILWTFNAPLEYTNQLNPRGKDMKVTVSVVESPAQFYVQYASKLDIINNIQEAVNAYCLNQSRLKDLSSISIGSPVAAFFEDNTWYRAMVVGINIDSVKVLYVDYGNRSDVPLNHLCQITRELVTKWRTQAVECCLVGFENCGDVSEALKMKMSNRALGVTYNLRLMSILNSSRLLVDLIDNLGGKLSDEISYSPPPQVAPYRDTAPLFQKSTKEHGSSISAPSFDSSIESGEQKVKFKPDNAFSRPSQRHNSFQSMESPYNEHDNRDVDQNKNRGYNRQKGFERGSARFKSEDIQKKSPEGFEEEKPRRRFGDDRSDRDDRGARGSIDSRGSDELVNEKPRRPFGGPRFRSDDDKTSEPFSDDRPRRGGFSRQRDDDKGSDMSNDDRPRRSFNARSRTDDDKADQFGDDKPRRGFRGNRQEEDKGRSFGGRERFPKSSNWEGGDDKNENKQYGNDRRGGRGIADDTRRSGRGGDDNERRGGRQDDNERRVGRQDDNERRGGRQDDNERRGGRQDDNERRGGRQDDHERRGGRQGGGNKWGGDGDSEDRTRRDNRRGGGDWKRDDGEERRGAGGERRFGGGGGSGGGRRGNWNKDDGGSGSGGWNGESRKKKFDNDFNSPKKSSQDSSDFNAKKPPLIATEDDWGDGGTDTSKPSNPPTANAITEYPMLNITANSEWKVNLSYMKNPHVFYVQPVGSDAILDDIRKIIEAETEASLVPVKDASLPLGTPVLTRFSLDQLLYRGLVQQVFPPSSAQILFIDYGNFDSVQISDLYLVTPKLAQTPPLAVRCSLIDVSPPGDKWPDCPNVYSKYFEAPEALTMNVVSAKMLDGELVLCVRISKPTGENVSQLLAQDGLAVSSDKTFTSPSEVIAISSFDESMSQPLEEGPEQVLGKIEESIPDKWVDSFDLLVGQKLYCTILETVEENLFVVSITEADVIALAAAWTDLQHITRLAPGTKTIAEVKAVQDDRLKILFFDTDGNLMNPKDYSTPRRISPICPFPVVRRSDHITIPHSEGAVIYIQRLSDADRLSKLLDDMFNFYDVIQPDSTTQWKIGEICAAKSDLDSNWYRARLITGPKEHTVRYIDYGSTEELSAENLRPLDPQFIFSELCMSVLLPVYWRTPNPPLLELVEGEELFAKLTKDLNGKWIADLAFANGDKVIKKLVERNIATEKTETPFDEENIIIGSDLTAGDSVDIVVSHDDSITMFWAQMIRHINLIDELQDKLQNLIVNLNEGNQHELKAFAAQYSEDNVWYRATMVSDNTLRFIDYGNTDVISQQLKELPPDLMRPVSGYAIPMYLCVKPVSQEWPEEAIAIHQAFIEKPEITAEIINVDYKIVVDIKSEGKLLSQTLIEAGFAEYNDYIPDIIRKHSKERCPANQSSSDASPEVMISTLVKPVLEPVEVEHPEIGEKDKVFVVLPTSLNNFYIQEELKTDTVHEIQNTLLTVELVKYTGTVEVGQLFAVQFEEDDLWYRAKVLSIQPKIEVSLIDYGNIVTTSDLRILPEDVVSYPPLAIHCSFETQEIPELLPLFLNITNFGQTPFHIKFKSFGFPHVVSLLTEDGRDVLDILLSHSKVKLPAIEKRQSENLKVEYVKDQESPEKDHPSHSSSQEGIDEDSLKIIMKLVEPELDVFKQGYISHINSIKDFYIQEIHSMTILDQINDTFSIIEDLNIIKEEFKTGDLVAAKYIDEGWYRGVVIQKEPVIIVRFIDYGNENEVVEVYDLPNSLKNLPPVAIKCCLSVDDNTLCQNADDKFFEISGGGATLFSFKILSMNDNTSTIELRVDDRNVVLDLTEKNACSFDDEEVGICTTEEVTTESSAISEAEIPKTNSAEIPNEVSSCEKHETENEVNAEVKIVPESKAEYDAVPESKTEYVAVPESKTVCAAVSESKTEFDPVPESKTVCAAVSESKTEFDPVPESKTEFDAVPESKTECNGVTESRTECDAVEESKTEFDAVPESKTECDAVPESKTECDAVLESKTECDAVPESKTECDGIPVSKTVCNGVTESKTECDAVLESKTECDAVQESKTECDAVQESKTECDGVPESKTDCDAVPESKTEYDAVPESKIEYEAVPESKINSESQIAQNNIAKECIVVATEPHIQNEFVVTNGEHSSENSYEVSKFYITSAKGPDDFYLYVETIESRLIETILNGADSYEKMIEIDIGDMVIVKNDDGKWYRGKVLESEECSYQVFLIDNGQIITSSDLRRISAELAAIRQSVLHCSLELPKDVVAWSSEAVAEFSRTYNHLVIDKYDILDNSTNPYIVKIITSNGDLTNNLKVFSSTSKLETSNDTDKLEDQQSSLLLAGATMSCKSTFEDNRENYIKKKDCEVNDSSIAEGTENVCETENIKSETPVDEALNIYSESNKPDLEASQKNVANQVSTSNGSPAKRILVNKPVKTIAEIKASAKSKIVTRSSKTPDRHSNIKILKSSPVGKVKSESELDENRSASPVEDITMRRSLPRAHSLNMDERPVPGSLSQPPSPDLSSRPRVSKVDKIVPGAISAGLVIDQELQ